MKKFKFELEDILKFRKFEQHQAEVELGKALAEEQEIQAKLDNLAQQKFSASEYVRGSEDFTDITTVLRFNEFIRTQTEFLMNKMAEAKLITEQKRNVLKEIIKKTDALERLKEHQLEEYKNLVNLEEENIVDDIVTSRFKKD
jgi:flagellar FliJ protein